MSRVRERSKGALQGIATLRASQQVAAASVQAASSAKVARDAIVAIDVPGINTALTDLDARVTALEP